MVFIVTNINIHRIPKDSGLLGSKPAITPIHKGLKFNTNQSALLIDPERYKDPWVDYCM